MRFLFELAVMGTVGAVGVAVGVLLAKRRTYTDELLACYTEYFSEVLSIATEENATSAKSTLFRLSRTSRRLELVEPDGTCVMATGLLFARCNALVSALASGAAPASFRVSACRDKISEEYANALELVRQRLALPRRVPLLEQNERLVVGAPRLVTESERSG